jgi:hypothetical protein
MKTMRVAGATRREVSEPRDPEIFITNHQTNQRTKGEEATKRLYTQSQLLENLVHNAFKSGNNATKSVKNASKSVQ